MSKVHYVIYDERYMLDPESALELDIAEAETCSAVVRVQNGKETLIGTTDELALRNREEIVRIQRGGRA